MPHIEVTNLSVDFPVYGGSGKSLKKVLLSQATGGRVMGQDSKTVIVRALDDVSFSVGAGDRVALSGHNGSGKSTLLRVLAGLYSPTGGRVAVTGTASAIMHPHAGIDPDATGLENIYLRGRVLGLSNRQIKVMVDDIVAFTELESFIALPMRTYSAGMFARLTFAVSTAIDPDILIIDEGIGAGDASFVHKAEARLTQMLDKAPILVLASHDEGLISKLCNRRLRFEHGRIIEDKRLKDSLSDGAPKLKLV